MSRHQFVATIDCDNAAFYDSDRDQPDPGPELARILRKLADDVDDNGLEMLNKPLVDVNGNRVGTATFGLFS